MPTSSWFPNQRVITRDGTIAVVAFVTSRGDVFGWTQGRATPVLIFPLNDAWGGEHDCELCNAA